MKKQNSILLFFISIVIAVIAVITFFPKSHPYYGLKNIAPADTIEHKAASIINGIKLNVSGYDRSINLAANQKFLRYVQKQFGIEKSNEKILDGLPAYRWLLTWRKPESKIDTEEPDQEKIEENYLNSVKMTFDHQGNLESFTAGLDDEASHLIISEPEARKHAAEFIKKYSAYKDIVVDTIGTITENQQALSLTLSSGTGVKIEDDEPTKPRKRTDYKFSFVSDDIYTSNKVNLEVSMKGNFISEFNSEQVLPKEIESKPYYPEIVEVLFGIILIILLVVTGYKKMRAYEIGLKSSVIIGIIAALGLVAEMLFQIQDGLSWQMLIGVVLGPLFLGLGITIVWAVSEATGREVWKEKYTELDLLFNGYFFHSRIGLSIINGLSLGFILLSVWLVVVYLIGLFSPLSITLSESNNTILTGSYDAWFLLGRNSYRSIFKATLLVVFVSSLLRKRFETNKIILILGGLIWAVSVQGYLEPFWFTLILEFFIGMIIIYSLLKFNVLVVIVTVYTFANLMLGTSFLYMKSNVFESSAILFIVFLGIPVAYSILSIIIKDKVEDFDFITPVFAKNITERQRLQGEIQAAKSIQESFLPSRTPEIERLDIAAKCLPALEVGGDYYDFVKHDQNNLSIIIGDVAGKGTKAAFVMTLTKGFFKALTRNITPPAKMLADINEMFYENVGRGSFISMIYGRIDFERNQFVFARAGHNPPIFKKAEEPKAVFLQPDGIALGMEKGILFSKTIRETAIDFAPGDIIVLYTDGFTEAMNSKKQQYGEEALKSIIERNSNLTANELMETIFKETLRFIGKEKQYDDMTIVVVKIN